MVCHSLRAFLWIGLNVDVSGSEQAKGWTILGTPCDCLMEHLQDLLSHFKYLYKSENGKKLKLNEAICDPE